MLVIHRRIDPQPVWAAELHLTFEARSKSRLRCFSAEGEDVGLFLERGQPPLYDGECLQAEDGRIVRVCARPRLAGIRRHAAAAGHAPKTTRRLRPRH